MQLCRDLYIFIEHRTWPTSLTFELLPNHSLILSYKSYYSMQKQFPENLLVILTLYFFPDAFLNAELEQEIRWLSLTRSQVVVKYKPLVTIFWYHLFKIGSLKVFMSIGAQFLSQLINNKEEWFVRVGLTSSSWWSICAGTCSCRELNGRYFLCSVYGASVIQLSVALHVLVGTYFRPPWNHYRV